MCNGYYAPSFGEPLCGTCHAFLFPVAAEEKRSTDLSDNDEDSGNDEPPYRELREVNTAFAIHQHGQNEEQIDSDEEPEKIRQPSPALEPDNDAPPQLPVASTSKSTNDRIAIYENAFLGDRPDPQPPRNLRQYLNALTESTHDANQIPVQQYVNVVCNEAAAAAASASTVKKLANTISALPVEVLLVVFSYLDDISLGHVGEVCKQWKNILEIHTPQSLWQRYTRTRWPLYHQITNTTNWFKVK